MVVKVYSERVAGFWYPSPLKKVVFSASIWFHCLQATWQALQPVHFVRSIKNVLWLDKSLGTLMRLYLP